MKVYKGQIIYKIIISIIVMTLFSYSIEIKDNVLALIFMLTVLFFFIKDSANIYFFYEDKLIIKNRLNFLKKDGETIFFKQIDSIKMIKSYRAQGFRIYFKNGKKKIYSLPVMKMDECYKYLLSLNIKVSKNW
jgi:hypothetical protein